MEERTKTDKRCIWFGHKLRLKNSRIIWCDRCNRKVDYSENGYTGEMLLNFDVRHQFRLIYPILLGIYLIGILGYMSYQFFILSKNPNITYIILFIPLLLLMNNPSISKPIYLD